ncbi:MAG: bifunctional riboflavin kinase/FAD synthetase [Mycobacterium sp.]|uniref:bifunctional riboflavin kinase/FAD synthetase n=3 Tax=Mycobacterium sp. TaxID=1785 RepID=UPI003BB5FBDD
MSSAPASALTRDERGVVTYTLDDPATRNAMSTRVLADLDRTLAALAQDAAVRVIVFTGAGSTFSSGADRSELGDPATIEKTTALLSSILTRIDSSPVPVMCRVNGAAFGAGLAVVAAADISIAADDAVFGLPEVRFGLVAGPAAAACMARIGQTAALDLLLTGRRFGAREADRMHLLSAVVERAVLDDTVEARISELLLGDYDALAATRRLARQLSGPSMAQRLEAVRAAAEAETTGRDGYQRRGLARSPVRDVDWRDVPARPGRTRPTTELHPDLRSELLPLGPVVVTVGTFDGIHRGHTAIISRAVARARILGLPSVLLTFDPHPAEVVRPDTHQAVLTTIARRAELAAELGVDHVRVVEFDVNVAHLESTEFVRQVLVERLNAAEVLVGANFRFGYQASGSVQRLSELGERFGFVAEAVDLVRLGDVVISATLIRSCIEGGDVEQAGSALGRAHRVDGLVEHGDHRGRSLGFPTANLRIDRFAAVPADGVYAGRVVLLDEWGQTDESTQLGAAAISVGRNTTFDGQHRRVEAHILDGDIDLYGRLVGVEFDRRLRGMIRFDSVETLVEQMKRDVEQTRDARTSAQ